MRYDIRRYYTPHIDKLQRAKELKLCKKNLKVEMLGLLMKYGMLKYIRMYILK